MKGNPDPLEFKITYYESIGGLWLVSVHYPNCTNYEGRKIIVMTTKAYSKALDGYLDPHFLKDNGIVARLERVRTRCNIRKQ